MRHFSRRHFAQLCLAGRVLSAAAAPSRTLRGVFPIALSPFTDRDQLDLDTLESQFRFMDRKKIPGFVWPQLASEWDTLRNDERMAGMERLGNAARQAAHTALVLGVQSPDGEQAIRFAKHAQQVGASAIISLPPPGETDLDRLIAYFRDIGNATSLPLMLQAAGQFPAENVVKIAQRTPTLRYVKDESGNPLLRFAMLREAGIGVFSGAHGKTLFDEMNRGFSGTMPATSFADLYHEAWIHWERGAKKQALSQFGRASILISELTAYPDAMKYVLYLRGVFPNYRLRKHPQGLLDDSGKKTLSELVQALGLEKTRP